MRNQISHKSQRLKRTVLIAVISAMGCLFIGLPFSAVFANDLDNSSYEKMFWRERPINIHLKTGVERVIRFPSPVQVGVPSHLIGAVTIESASNVAYIKALGDFEPVRFRFRRLDTGDIYLFNVSSSNAGSSGLLELVDAVSSNDEVSQAAEGSNSKNRKPPSYGYLTLTRYAFQNIYSPERLIKPLRGVSGYTIKSKSPIRHLVPGEEISAVPWAQWKSHDGMYVTAVYLSNLSERTVQLDPRVFRHSKEWLSTSLFAGYLAPHNALGDSTAMVIVSRSPWEDSVEWLR